MLGTFLVGVLYVNMGHYWSLGCSGKKKVYNTNKAFLLGEILGGEFEPVDKNPFVLRRNFSLIAPCVQVREEDAVLRFGRAVQRREMRSCMFNESGLR